MKMLVIGSCTGDKNVRDCPGLLTQSDFDDPSLFHVREAELSALALPTRERNLRSNHRRHAGWALNGTFPPVVYITTRRGCGANFLINGLTHLPFAPQPKTHCQSFRMIRSATSAHQGVTHVTDRTRSFV